MCRFAAYMGNEEILLNELLDNPENSLISQSRQAREGKLGLNADGFGVGWYQPETSDIPGVYRSIKPAWNDDNLISLGSVIKSKCFIGHVRASTVGDLTEINCHPFSHKHFMFVHNGTIREFPLLKRKISRMLTDEFYNVIHGNTDSEYFFALLMQKLHDFDDINQISNMKKAVIESIKIINELQQSLDGETFCRINSVFSNGHGLVITKYVSDIDHKPMSLHYNTGAYVIEDSDDEMLMQPFKKTPDAFIVSSEPLTDYKKEWVEIETNTIMTVNEDIKITTEALKAADL